MDIVFTLLYVGLILLTFWVFTFSGGISARAEIPNTQAAVLFLVATIGAIAWVVIEIWSIQTWAQFGMVEVVAGSIGTLVCLRTSYIRAKILSGW